MMNGRDIMDCIIGTELDNFYLCPCSPELAGVEAELYSREKREYALRETLEKARPRFNYIFIDCPPSLGFLTLNALSAADSILIPVQTEFFCMEGIPDLLHTLNEVRTYFNPELTIEGILLTMFDERTNLSKQVADEVRKSLKSVVYEVVIPRSIRLAEAPSFGKPVLLYDIQSRGAEAYLNLAEEILAEMKKALGKGIKAFIPEEFGILKDEKFAEVDIELVKPNPDQPRLDFDDDAIEELAQSIREAGILQPIVVVPEAGFYKIIIGERRWRAAQKAGLQKIPVLIRHIPREEPARGLADREPPARGAEPDRDRPGLSAADRRARIYPAGGRREGRQGPGFGHQLLCDS